MPPAQPAYLLLGEILRPHGVRGELRMRIHTDYPERIAELETVYLGRGTDDQRARPYTVQAARFHHDYLLLQLEDIPDRSAAERLRGLKVMIDFANAIPLDDDEVYLYQLIGLRVESETGEVLGEVRHILETGANDVYIVDSPTYGEILIPVHDETLIRLDVDEGVVVVRLPDGLLPERPA